MKQRVTRHSESPNIDSARRCARGAGYVGTGKGQSWNWNTKGINLCKGGKDPYRAIWAQAISLKLSVFVDTGCRFLVCGLSRSRRLSFSCAGVVFAALALEIFPVRKWLAMIFKRREGVRGSG